ncbi:MAG: hypothetical protein ACTH6N_05880 [Brachybacterium tyrofermentans]|uniref:hypothetical protein n=1 Tax=Brachybacterium tyrofermentans TaxID=47848 RepID=UPI0018676867|nr:hypothetical protein [Brachybacterium tyrofermentans]
MADDVLAAMLAAIERRADDTDLPRMPRNARSTANINNPMKPIPQRPDRRTQRSYADPTGETAVGNRKRKR